MEMDPQVDAPVQPAPQASGQLVTVAAQQVAVAAQLVTVAAQEEEEEEEEEGGRATAYNRLESRIDLIDWSNRPHKKMAKVHVAKFMNVLQSS